MYYLQKLYKYAYFQCWGNIIIVFDYGNNITSILTDLNLFLVLILIKIALYIKRVIIMFTTNLVPRSNFMLTKSCEQSWVLGKREGDELIAPHEI